MALRRGVGAVFAGIGATSSYCYWNVLAREKELPSHLLPVFETMTSKRDGDSHADQSREKRRVIIIGAGVVGISAAYKLAKQGHAVAILEPRPEPGEECSACAAGGMQISNPVVDRASWIAVLKCIAPKMAQLVFGGKENPDAFKFFQMSWASTLSDPFFLRWVTTFTKTSLFPGQAQKDKQTEMLDFTKFAVDDMVKMLEDPKDDMGGKVGYNSRGSLAVSYDDPIEVTATTGATAGEFENDAKTTANPVDNSRNFEPSRRISGREALEIEPALCLQEKQPTSAKFEYDAKSASSGRFAKELAHRCANDPALDVTFHYNTKVQAIKRTKTATTGSMKPIISELHTNRGVINVPDDVKIVVAAGAWTPHILALMDLYVPVYPLKGYAMSISANEAFRVNPKTLLPSRIVCDKYMFTTRLGDEIRFTSIGEFSGWNTQPDREVDTLFRKEATRQFPQLKDLILKAETLCGHRPLVSDGILLLGQVDTHDNLFVTCGPGSNGWKLALGSGEVIERLVSGQSMEELKDELGFDAEAFSPAGRVLHAPIFAKLCRSRWGV